MREIRSRVFYGGHLIDESISAAKRTLLTARYALNTPANDEEGATKEGSAPYASFPRQDKAFAFAEEWLCDHPTERPLAIFSYQRHSDGLRRFLATTYEEFWRRYSSLHESHRHHYEIIRESSPCHLYFDLEFDQSSNPALDGRRVVTAFLAELRDSLRERYGVAGWDEGRSVELDSSTEGKFSRHSIVHLPGCAFADNQQMGLYVRQLCWKLQAKALNGDESCRQFIVAKPASQHNASEERTFFVDTGVYTRNRAFRLYLSSKHGKDARLKPTGGLRRHVGTPKELFMDSLICNIEPGCTLLSAEGPIPSLHTRLPVATSTTPSAHFDNDLATQQHECGASTTTRAAVSPYPELDAFIERVASIGGVAGKVRTWAYFPAHNSLVYSIQGNRFCGNIGRPHKSNNVMYVAHLSEGVYYQKCHDPECRDYRSEPQPIPPELRPRESQSVDAVDVVDAVGVVDAKQHQGDGEGDDAFWREVAGVADRTQEEKLWWQEAVLQMELLEGQKAAQ